MGSWRLPGVERLSFKTKAVFEAILEAILTLRASKIEQKSFKMGSKIEAFFAPGRFLASILGAFWA